MRKLDSFRGLAVLVTGASSGIGRLLAVRIARDGARLALASRRADRLEDVAREVREVGGEALCLPCDVGDRAQSQAACERAVRALGGIDVLVNNAGYGRHDRFLEWDIEDMERMTRVNYLGSVYFTRFLLPQMVERRRGWVVFVSSVAGRIGVPDETLYSASKFALTGFAEALSLEVEDSGVHVLSVFPGAIRTPFFDARALERLPQAARRRMAEPGDLVSAIVRALARGDRELTFPRSIAPAYAIRALAPGLFRGLVKRATLRAPMGGSAPSRPDAG